MPLKVLISNDDGKVDQMCTKSTFWMIRVWLYVYAGPPSQEESPFILPFLEHLEGLGWDVK